MFLRASRSRFISGGFSPSALLLAMQIILILQVALLVSGALGLEAPCEAGPFGVSFARLDLILASLVCVFNSSSTYVAAIRVTSVHCFHDSPFLLHRKACRTSLMRTSCCYRSCRPEVSSETWLQLGCFACRADGARAAWSTWYTMHVAFSV